MSFRINILDLMKYLILFPDIFHSTDQASLLDFTKKIILRPSSRFLQWRIYLASSIAVSFEAIKAHGK